MLTSCLTHLTFLKASLHSNVSTPARTNLLYTDQAPVRAALWRRLPPPSALPHSARRPECSHRPSSARSIALRQSLNNPGRPANLSTLDPRNGHRRARRG